jgi:DNA-binding NtrC family response regulator
MLPKILYVDDEIINLKVFQVLFRNHYDVVTCENPLDAIDRIVSENIDVIITDYKMPGMNGMDLISQIKEKFPSKICMILSGFLESDVVLDKTKVYAFIAKPLQKDKLLEHFNLAFTELN